MADIITPAISATIQMKLTETEFNNSYLIITKLRLELQPSGSCEFMRLSKEYYTLQFKAFNSVPEYLTKIKVLEEKVDATKVVLDTNTRTILCLSMSLPNEYQYLVQIWAVTPSITAEKARQMVLEASRQHSQARQNDYELRHAMQAGTMQAGHRERYKHCGSANHQYDKCWMEHPDLAPEWFKEKMGRQIQRRRIRGKSGKEVPDQTGHYETR